MSNPTPSYGPCPGNPQQCSNTAAIMELKEDIGTLIGKMDGVLGKIQDLSDKLDEKHADHDRKIEKLDEILVKGNGEPAIRTTVRDLKRAHDDYRAAREAAKADRHQDERDSRNNRASFYIQASLLVINLVVGALVAKLAVDVKAAEKAIQEGAAQPTAIRPTATNM